MSMATRVLKVPTINTITGLGTVFIAGGFKERIVKTLYKISQKRVTKIFMLNKEDYTIFENSNLCKSSILTLTPGAGVNLNSFQYRAISNTIPTFLFIGRMIKDKGVLEFIEAAQSVSRKHPSARFKLLGPIDSQNLSALTRDSLDTLINNNNAIQYLGEVHNVHEHIRDAYCVVLPSYREGVPTVLLESLATGRPIITTNAPGCNTVVDDCINGFIVPVKDSMALTQAMKRILTMSHNELNIMGKFGRIKAETEFDENAVIAQYLQEVNSALIK